MAVGVGQQFGVVEQVCRVVGCARAVQQFRAYPKGLVELPVHQGMDPVGLFEQEAVDLRLVGVVPQEVGVELVVKIDRVAVVHPVVRFDQAIEGVGLRNYLERFA